MPQTINLDVIIFGGGVAGLWSLAKLRQSGYAAVLLESQRLGGVQTLASQGIIHGGTKYALTGHLTNSAQTIGAMPGIWRACLAGTGELDLSTVTVLAKHQYLWSTGNLGSTLVGLLASQAMRSRVVTIDQIASRPPILQHSEFKGYVYRLEEPVLDMAAFTKSLVNQNADACMRLQPQTLQLINRKPFTIKLIDAEAGPLQLTARRLVLAAGAGNRDLLAIFGLEKLSMQLRPLHMLIVKGALPQFYAHCLGVGMNPRLTITSHPLANGEWIWYIGGQIAESGVERSIDEQIAFGKQELKTVFPWLNINATSWASLRIERAEPRQPGGLRPERPFLETHNGISVTWPTKLAFAPVLATELLKSLEQEGVNPSGMPVTFINWPQPLPPVLPWELITEWI